MTTKDTFQKIQFADFVDLFSAKLTSLSNNLDTSPIVANLNHEQLESYKFAIVLNQFAGVILVLEDETEINL